MAKKKKRSDLHLLVAITGVVIAFVGVSLAAIRMGLANGTF